MHRMSSLSHSLAITTSYLSPGGGDAQYSFGKEWHTLSLTTGATCKLLQRRKESNRVVIYHLNSWEEETYDTTKSIPESVITQGKCISISFKNICKIYK